MGRKTLPDAKIQIAARVAPRIKAAIVAVASQERRTESQVIELLLEDSPKLKAQMNGKKK